MICDKQGKLRANPTRKKKKTLRTDTRDVYRMPTEWKVAKRKSKIREEFVYRAKCRSKTSLYKEKKKFQRRCSGNKKKTLCCNSEKKKR